MELLERVKITVDSYLEANGIELVDMVYRAEAGGMVLRLLVDKQGGIKLSECEALNKFLGEALDAEDAIAERYTIEVSSPGLDRHLATDRDFERVMGQALEVNTYGPVDGKRYASGRLLGMTKEAIVLEYDGISTRIPRNKIAMARLKLEF